MTTSTTSITTDLRNTAERAAWTFAEAFLAVIVLTDTSTLRTAAVGALAAAVVPIKEFIKRRKALADASAEV